MHGHAAWCDRLAKVRGLQARKPRRSYGHSSAGARVAGERDGSGAMSRPCKGPAGSQMESCVVGVACRAGASSGGVGLLVCSMGDSRKAAGEDMLSRGEQDAVGAQVCRDVGMKTAWGRSHAGSWSRTGVDSLLGRSVVTTSHRDGHWSNLPEARRELRHVCEKPIGLATGFATVGANLVPAGSWGCREQALGQIRRPEGMGPFWTCKVYLDGIWVKFEWARPIPKNEIKIIIK